MLVVVATVLCIGEPQVLATRRLVLEQNGYAVRDAHTDAEALDALRRGPVDCVLVGHDPPWMDGAHVIAKIGQLYPKIPIVVVTPFPAPVQMLAAEYLSGLEGPEALLSAIQRALDNKLPARSDGEQTRQAERQRLDENLRTSLQLSADFKELQEKTITTIRRIRGAG